MEVTYLGSDKFNANKTSISFTVVDHIKQNTTIDSDVAADNDNVTITVNVNATGFVKFTMNGNELFAEVKEGKAVLNTILPDGNYTITATYIGDDEFNENATVISFTVDAPEKSATEFTNIVINDKVVTLVLRDTDGNVVSGAISHIQSTVL